VEGIIAGLLQDFENGRMTRRQLIQSLALAATAAAASPPVLAQSVPAAPPIAPAFRKTPWQTVWLDHISFQVTDYRRSTAFYRDLMGWEIRTDDGSGQCTLKIGDIGEIIIRNRPSPTASVATGRGQSASPSVNAVVDHISFGVEPWDTDKVKTELESRGLMPRPDMVGDNFKSFHVKDPDGWDLQISNQTHDTRQ
jgi:catechol 2,3-dioxygenase-like lactoylglutathione lyase family enzyme